MILSSYDKYSKELKGDTNFCMVIATAVAFEEDVKEIQELYSKNGRPLKRGTPWEAIAKTINYLEKKHTEFKIKKYADQRFKRVIKDAEDIKIISDKTITPNNCWEYLDENKNYIMFSSTHAIGVRKGKVIDWTEGRSHRVKAIIEIDKGITTGLQNWIASL